MSTKFRIYKTDEFRSALTRLDSQAQRFVETKLVQYVYPQLREWPYKGTNIRKLQGRSGTWRYRVGRFRIFYDIDEMEKIVNMITIDQRKDAYR